MKMLMTWALLALSAGAYADTPTTTPTGTATATGTRTPTRTVTKTATITLTATRTATVTPSVTRTNTKTATATPSPTITTTFTVTPTKTPQVTPIPTPQFNLLWSHVVVGPSTRLVSLTLTASTDWQYVALNCDGAPCSALLYNTANDSMYWWMDNSTSAPAFGGVELPKNTSSITLEAWPGAVLHWRFKTADGPAYLQNRW